MIKFFHTSKAFLLKNPVTLAIFRISLTNAFGKLVFLGRLKAEEVEMEETSTLFSRFEDALFPWGQSIKDEMYCTQTFRVK